MDGNRTPFGGQGKRERQLGEGMPEGEPNGGIHRLLAGSGGGNQEIGIAIEGEAAVCLGSGAGNGSLGAHANSCLIGGVGIKGEVAVVGPVFHGRIFPRLRGGGGAGHRLVVHKVGGCGLGIVVGKDPYFITVGEGSGRGGSTGVAPYVGGEADGLLGVGELFRVGGRTGTAGGKDSGEREGCPTAMGERTFLHKDGVEGEGGGPPVGRN